MTKYKKVKTRYRVGNMFFPSKEYFDNLIRLGLIARYDCSPQLREQHDKMMEKKRGSLPMLKRLEAHIEEIGNSLKRESRPIKGTISVWS